MDSFRTTLRWPATERQTLLRNRRREKKCLQIGEPKNETLPKASNGNTRALRTVHVIPRDGESLDTYSPHVASTSEINYGGRSRVWGGTGGGSRGSPPRGRSTGRQVVIRGLRARPSKSGDSAPGCTRLHPAAFGCNGCSPKLCAGLRRKKKKKRFHG